MGFVTPTPMAPESKMDTISVPALLKIPRRDDDPLVTMFRIVTSFVCAEDPFQPDPRNVSAEELNPVVPAVAVPVVSATTLLFAGSPANVPRRDAFSA